MLNYLLAGCGGFLGSMARYALGGWVHQWTGIRHFPLGTLVVNLTGCLLIGLLGGLADTRGLLSSQARVFLLIGVLGGFTTFSSFGYETMNLLRDSQFGLALLNAGVQVMVGLAAVWAGLTLARAM
jgi:CrcB protein